MLQDGKTAEAAQPRKLSDAAERDFAHSAEKNYYQDGPTHYHDYYPRNYESGIKGLLKLGPGGERNLDDRWPLLMYKITDVSARYDEGAPTVYEDNENRNLSIIMPVFRAEATLEVGPVLSGDAAWQIGWITACSKYDVYSHYALCSDKSPFTLQGKLFSEIPHRFVCCSDMQCDPWHDGESLRHVAANTATIQHIKVPLNGDNEKHVPDIRWMRTLDGKDMQPYMTNISEEYFSWLVLRNLNTMSFFVIKTIVWHREFQVSMDPNRPVGSRILSTANLRTHYELSQIHPLPEVALRRPFWKESLLVRWYPERSLSDTVSPRVNPRSPNRAPTPVGVRGTQAAAAAAAAKATASPAPAHPPTTQRPEAGATKPEVADARGQLPQTSEARQAPAQQHPVSAEESSHAGHLARGSVAARQPGAIASRSPEQSLQEAVDVAASVVDRNVAEVMKSLWRQSESELKAAAAAAAPTDEHYKHTVSFTKTQVQVRAVDRTAGIEKAYNVVVQERSEETEHHPSSAHNSHNRLMIREASDVDQTEGLLAATTEEERAAPQEEAPPPPPEQEAPPPPPEQPAEEPKSGAGEPVVTVAAPEEPPPATPSPARSLSPAPPSRSPSPAPPAVSPEAEKTPSPLPPAKPEPAPPKPTSPVCQLSGGDANCRHPFGCCTEFCTPEKHVE